MDNKKASHSRRSLLGAAQSILSLVQEIARERGPLLRGAFQLRGTRCGKDNCKCAQGELHTTAVLIVSDDGRRRSFYVRPPERPEVQRRVKRYLGLRGKRIEMKKLSEELLVALDDLVEALAEPHTPLREAKAEPEERCPRGKQRTKA
jgi:hypothetical protein